MGTDDTRPLDAAECGAPLEYGDGYMVCSTHGPEPCNYAALVAAARDVSRVGDVLFSEDQLLATVPAYKMLALRAALDGEPDRGVNSQAGWITPSGPLDKDPI